jgi:hypothetical protein
MVRQRHDLVQHAAIKPAHLIASLNPSSDWKLALGSLAVGAREEGAEIFCPFLASVERSGMRAFHCPWSGE